MVRDHFLLLTVVVLLLDGGHRVYAGAGSIGLGGGLSIPSADLRRGVGDGPHIAISWSYPINSHSQIGVDGYYNYLTEKTQTTQLFGPVTGTEKATIIEAMPCFRVFLGPKRGRVVPYFKAGIGVDYVRPDLTLTTAYGSIRTTESHVWPGELVGLAASTRIGKTRAVSIEGLFHVIQSNDGQSDEFYTVGLTLWLGSELLGAR
jgi:hypothetical protein